MMAPSRCGSGSSWRLMPTTYSSAGNTVVIASMHSATPQAEIRPNSRNAGNSDVDITRNALTVVPDATNSGMIKLWNARRIASASSCLRRSILAREKKWMPASMPMPMSTVEIRLVIKLRRPSTTCVSPSDHTTPHASGNNNTSTARHDRNSR